MRVQSFKETFTLINIICLLVFALGSFLIARYAIEGWKNRDKTHSVQVERILSDIPMLSSDSQPALPKNKLPIRQERRVAL